MNKRRLLIATLVWAFGASPVLAQSAAAERFPTKPIRLILPFPPGGSVDQTARLVAPLMAEKLGQPVVIDNRPGAGGAIALNAVAQSPADGYTLGVGTIGGLGLAKLMGQAQPYDALKDFAPVGLMITIPFVVVASNSSQIANLKDLIARSKQEAGLPIGHGGNGSQMHLSAELLAQMSRVKLTPVAYRGMAPATQDVMSGQIPLAISDTTTAIQQINAGTLKAVGVTSAKRSPALPDVPTIAEQGLAGYESTGWVAMVAPAKTPPEVIAKINAALNAALNAKSIRDTIHASGSEPSPGTPQQLGELIRSSLDRWGKVVKSANIRVE